MPDPGSVAPRGGALPPAAVAVMLLLAFLWGFNTVAVKVAAGGIPPVLQAGLRSVAAALLVFAWCRLRGISFGDWRRNGSLAPGLLCGAIFALEFIALYAGVTLTTASRAIVFLFGAPFWVALGAHWLIPGDGLTRAKALGLCVAFAGLLLAFADGLLAPVGEGALLGDLLCLAAGVLWAATTLLVKASRLGAAPPAMVLQVQLVVSAPVMLLAAPLLGEPLAIDPQPTVLLAFAYQACIASASYLAWFHLVARHSASRLSAFSVLTPVFGVAAGALVLGERLGEGFGAAVVLVAIGLWLVNRPAR